MKKIFAVIIAVMTATVMLTSCTPKSTETTENSSKTEITLSETSVSLKDDFYAMVEPMDEEHQASFHAAFMEGVIALLDKAIDEGDYDSVKGQFEDAGVADDMDTILRAPGLKESYGAIKSAYLTMGNSED